VHSVYLGEMAMDDSLGLLVTHEKEKAIAAEVDRQKSEVIFTNLLFVSLPFISKQMADCIRICLLASLQEWCCVGKASRG